MKIQINSDKKIRADNEFINSIREQVKLATGKFRRHLTRVEVHLSDVNSSKTAKNHKRRLIEARPAGQKPLVATW